MHLHICLLLFLAFGLIIPVQAQSIVDESALPPSLASLLDEPASEMAPVVERYQGDRAALLRRYDALFSDERRDRLRDFYSAWMEELQAVEYGSLSLDGQIDHRLLRNEIDRQRHQLGRDQERLGEMADYLPFESTVTRLFIDWRGNPEIDPRAVADSLDRITGAIQSAMDGIEAAEDDAERMVAYRAVGATEALANQLEEWYGFYDGYDPLFTWWAEAPYESAMEVLEEYEAFLVEDVVGLTGDDDDPIIGDPIGAEALEAELAFEMIPYSPAELIEIAEQELAWGEAQMEQAAAEMGYDDWRDALESVKDRHVEPGEQPLLVRELAEEAIDFVQERDLLTIPPLSEEVWRMTMLSPEWQEIAPFFLGGEVVRIAFPASEMAYAHKLMSIRGNNRHFSRAVVHHELIPGHHLQQFMTSRYNSHRRAFSTPFWMEGWALYWEMLLWDEGFAQTPEDRIGMLFWRNHRAARIIFSLSFHLGEMSPEEAIDFLVERVGHERANAEAEVRRSFTGMYPPLYQVAYMIGGLQFRALYKELVDEGTGSPREFHDTVLQSGNMPVELVRILLLEQDLPTDYETSWRFYDQ